MASSRTGCCLLPLAFLLLLGQPTQGKAGPWSPFGSLRPPQVLWAKQQATMYRQAVQAHKLVLDYLNRQHNTTFYRAPGVKTHIMIDMVFGRAFHVNTILVSAKCPEGYTDMDPTNCEIAPDAPKMECNAVAVFLFENEHPYVSEDSCREFKGPVANLPSSAEKEEEEEEEELEDETEATPFI